ncbi:MAG: ATP cone domain-containing protein, partial [Nanoarchaeota archaeon]
MIQIIKRHGHLEKFDERKVYASCYAACLNCHINKQEAEKICKKVSTKIKSWIKTKKQVSSDDIFKEMTKLLKKLNKDAAFM